MVRTGRSLCAAAIALGAPLAKADLSWSDRVRAALRGSFQQVTDEAVVAIKQPRAPPSSEAWAPLRDLLSKWEFTENYAVVVGDAENGRLFVYEHGNFSVHTPVETASTSKWPSAMMLAGLVNDGTIEALDEPVNKYLSWWTKDPKDPRSRVTYRHLLTFTSGFGDGHPGDDANMGAKRRARKAGLTQAADPPKPAGCNSTTGDIIECAKAIYNEVKLIGEPGEVYSYNSNHLQLGGAVAVAASKLTLQQVIDKYLFKAFGMNESIYPGSNPDLATELRTTGHDYERFLTGVLSYKPLSQDIVDASERDATPFLSEGYTLYGNYAFGHFLSCYDSIDGMTDECREKRLHIDPGAFGFYPLIDRKYGYYMALVAFETGVFYPRSGIPEYLALAIKPIIDDIMLGKDVSQTSAHHTVTHNSLTLSDVNYIMGCYAHPETCS